MKRISVILLSLVFLVSMLIPVASAETFSQENITIEQNVFNITVTVTSDVDGRMTVRLSDNAKSTLYGIDFSNEPVEDDGVYTYEFNFTLENTVPTSVLRVCVANNVPSTEKTFNYTNINDKNRFYNSLDTISEPELISAYFSANQTFVSVDLTEYNELSSEKVLELVNQAIIDMPLATGFENLSEETAEYTAQKVQAVENIENIFKTGFAEAMKYAKILDSDQTEWETVVNTAITENLFDDEYYMPNGTVPAILSIGNVYDFFEKEVEAVSELTETETKNAFDRATLAAIKENCEYGTLKTAFLYFENKGAITVSDMTDIDALVSAGKDLELWKDLKDSSNNDCAELISNAISIADTMVLNGALSGSESNAPAGGNISNTTSPGGLSGGSLGGGGGLSAPSTPVTPDEPVVPEGTFTDIASVDWAKESIEALAEKGVINGKGNGKFAPNDSVTREEFVKIIIGAFDLLNENAKSDFGDVDTTRWSYIYVATANELGIVTGDGTTFNPTGAMSRQDMAVVIFRTAEKLGFELSGDAESFADAEEFADYAKDAIKALTASGIVNGMGDGTFAPKSTVTRAQAAKVIYGLMNLVGGGK